MERRSACNWIVRMRPEPKPNFLAGANLDNGDPETLLFSMTRFFKFLPGEQRQAFPGDLGEKAS